MRDHTETKVTTCMMTKEIVRLVLERKQWKESRWKHYRQARLYIKQTLQLTLNLPIYFLLNEISENPGDVESTSTAYGQNWSTLKVCMDHIATVESWPLFVLDKVILRGKKWRTRPTQHHNRSEIHKVIHVHDWSRLSEPRIGSSKTSDNMIGQKILVYDSPRNENWACTYDASGISCQQNLLCRVRYMWKANSSMSIRSRSQGDHQHHLVTETLVMVYECIKQLRVCIRVDDQLMLSYGTRQKYT